MEYVEAIIYSGRGLPDILLEKMQRKDFNMIRIGQIKLEPNHTKEDLVQKIAKILRITEKEIVSYEIRKQSIDARKKPLINFIYTVDVKVHNEQKVLKKIKGNQAVIAKDVIYEFPSPGNEVMVERPIIIGSGPAGLFCAYMLAEYGYRPIIFERGACVEERQKDIEKFWETGVLDTTSNIQFGEGGAGTFSDGKLNTLVKDPVGRNRKVLEIFVENGAPEDILYVNKPHIGTDVLIHVVKNMRERIISRGGEVHFHATFKDFELENGKLKSIIIDEDGVERIIQAQTLVLAIGHSARDTFEMLYHKKIEMSAKAFAIGVRVEHLQRWINESQYGKDCPYKLGAAAYKIATTLENGRGVYSFCMCPGGYVVNASSEEGRLAVNGMSYHARDGINANSAIIVTVRPDDFGSEHPLAGVEFQRILEKKAYEIGQGKVPVQRFEDFCHSKTTESLGKVLPQIKGGYSLANVREIFPEFLSNSIEEGIKAFEKQIEHFSDPDSILSGVESRTSSPVRIHRNEQFQVAETGIYPCGEGAGYAGGITSAAMDGLRISEEICKKFNNHESIH